MKKIGLVLSLAIFLGLSSCRAEQPNNVVHDIPIQAITNDLFVNIDGLKVRYRIEEQKGKPTLVLLHGFTSSLESWDGLVSKLQDYFQIVRFDLPGHGLTGPDPKRRYGHDDFVQVLHILIGKLEIQNPILVGNSMGGNTAWRYAASYPDELAKLVLIDASGFPLDGLSDEPLPLAPLLKSYFLEPTKFAVNHGLKNQFADASRIPKDRADKILEMMRQPGNGDAFVEIYKAFTLPDPRKKLAKITVPTLIIWGVQDGVIPVAHAQLFDEAIANSTLAIIENSGHVSHEEHPDKTAILIYSFLRER